MSTMFGVKTQGKFVAVARRSCGKMVWLNELAPLLPNKRKVHALDNNPQGIDTIGDVKIAISSGDICPSK